MQSHQQELSLVPKDMGTRVAAHTCAIGFWVTLGWSRRGVPVTMHSQWMKRSAINKQCNHCMQQVDGLMISCVPKARTDPK